MKKVFVIIFSIALFVMAIVTYLFNSIPDMESAYKSERLFFPVKSSELFFKSEVWGMTYDSRIIVLSANRDEKVVADPKKEYIFKGVSFVFYKLKHDSLIIYTPIRTTAPEQFNSKIFVEQIELDNVSMMKLFEGKEYLRQGLNIFE